MSDADLLSTINNQKKLTPEARQALISLLPAQPDNTESPDRIIEIEKRLESILKHLENVQQQNNPFFSIVGSLAGSLTLYTSKLIIVIF